MARIPHRRTWVVVAVLVAFAVSGFHDVAVGAQADAAGSEVGFDHARPEASSVRSPVRAGRAPQPGAHAGDRDDEAGPEPVTAVVWPMGLEPANGPPPRRGPPRRA